MSRSASMSRKTAETDIKLSLDLDAEGGTGKIETGIGFFDHMLNALSKHGNFKLDVQVKGDLHIDAHHSIEDVGIVFGKAFAQAVGDKKGITRFASVRIPLDEALSEVTLDIGGRAFLYYDLKPAQERVGEMDACLGEEFWRSFTDNAKVNLHIQNIRGQNAHHQLETIFKGVGRAIRQAVSIDPNESGVPSTKGTLDD